MAKPKKKPSDDAKLLRADPAPEGGFEVQMQSSVVPVLAGHLAALMETKDGGYLNAIEFSLEHDKAGPLILTMQRKQGEGAMALKAKAEALLLELVEAVERGPVEAAVVAAQVREYFANKPVAQPRVEKYPAKA